MALSLKKLERSLVKNFEDIRENGATEKESADGMANAIGEYAKDAEALVPTPFLLPGAPPIPDTSMIGKKVPVAGSDASKPALSSAILSSYKAQDPSFTIISSGIVTYVATFLNYATKPLIGIPATITGTTVIPPPVLTSVTAIGLGGGTILDTLKVMAGIIHTSFMAGTVTGVGLNPQVGATIPAPVVAKLI
tara:strand:- start:6474 stop:7052 length:579 start_codon:yes stop_codon:yes gene_type:complete